MCVYVCVSIFVRTGASLKPQSWGPFVGDGEYIMSARALTSIYKYKHATQTQYLCPGLTVCVCIIYCVLFLSSFSPHIMLLSAKTHSVCFLVWDLVSWLWSDFWFLVSWLCVSVCKHLAILSGVLWLKPGNCGLWTPDPGFWSFSVLTTWFTQ